MLSEIPEIEHVDATSLDDAVGWLTKYGERAKVIAGGTDLLGLMKDGIVGPKLPMPELLVNIKSIPGIDALRYGKKEGLEIGTAVTLHALETDGVVRGRFTALAEAAESVATSQIKYMGTIGGNLCQRPWCWYFRHPDYVCYKRGGKQCYAITVDNKYYFSVLGRGVCVMSHPSDLAPALIVLGAKVHVHGAGTERAVETEDFFVGPRNVEETVLKSNELVSRVTIPEMTEGTRSTFLKSRIRSTWDFALASVAVSMNVGEVAKEVRVALGGVAPFPYRAKDAEAELEERKLTDETMEKAAAAAVNKSLPLKMNAYKVRLTKALVKRAIARISKPPDSSIRAS